MIAIVESGATKSDWRLYSDGGVRERRFSTAGINVSTMKPDVIRKVLAEGLGLSECSSFKGFHLYTAGVYTEALVENLSTYLRGLVHIEELGINNDLLGAARAACQHEPGIVAIMGTGSNSCFYDGSGVSQKVWAGGYVIGDDGSAATLGRLFLADFIKGLVPDGVASEFSGQFDSDYNSIVENLYLSPSPSRYLGSLAPFIISHYGNPYIKELVDGNFKAFIERSLLRYDTGRYPVSVVGGFGCACKDIFGPLAAAAGIRISQYIPSPVEGLETFHFPG